MLDSLRAFSRTLFAKLFFAVLILSFALFGISNVVTAIGSTTVARVGNEDVSVKDFQRLYNQLAAQYGNPPPQQALAMGIPGAVLSQLSAEAAVNQIGAGLGLGVSEERLSKMVREDPSFFGTLGTYDPETAERVLQASGYTEAEYRDVQVRAARRDQLFEGLFADTAVPKAATELWAGFNSDTRTVDYFLLNAASLPPIPEATEEDLQAYLTANQAQFRTPETRTAKILVLSPQTLAATPAMTPTDAEIAAEYEKNKASLSVAEKRTLLQATLPDQATADLFTAGKAAGKTLDQIVAETGVKLSDMGTIAKSEILDPTLANAAFSTPAGDFTIIAGVGGAKRLVAVMAIEAATTPLLDEMKPEISQRLALAKARAGYIDILDQVEELMAAFQPFDDIAARFGLKLTELDMGDSGTELTAVPAIAETDRLRVATAIFAANPDAKLNPVIAIGANNNLWFDVTATSPARDQTLDEVRDVVLSAWTAEKTQDAMTSEVKKILDELDAGTPFADVASGFAQFPVPSGEIVRDVGDGTAQIDASVASATFAGGAGHHGAAPNAVGDYVVFEVTAIIPTADTSQAEAEVKEGTTQSLYSDFVTAVRNDIGVRENSAVLNQLLDLGGN